jgi:hypothetical protein
LILRENEKCDVKQMPIEAFDAWASSLCEEITGVKRDVWDAFARQKFLNYLLAEGILEMRDEADGTILLAETEEKTSAD